jgi:hypothetical protein
VTPRAFLRFFLFVALAIGLAGAGADGDLWGHVRFGRDLVANHQLVAHDTYSFTSDRPWVNHEWLAEGAMALAFGAAGSLGLNLLRIACLAIVLALVWRRLSPLNAPARIVDMLLVVTALGAYTGAQHVRPQMFSLVFFALLLSVLTDADRRDDWRPLAVVPLLMAVWANVHGGWIVGMECLFLWIACKVVLERRSARDRAMLIALAGASFLMTAVNPHGTGLWAFLLETVRVGRPNIEDWQPVYRLGGWFWVFWLLPATLAVAAAVRSRLQLKIAPAAIVLFLAAGSLMVNRLGAFFTLAVAFLMAEALTQNWPERQDPLAQRPARFLRFAAALVLVAAVPLFVWRAGRIQMGHPPMPEREAAAFVARSGLHGNVLVWFDWGEYVIWHCSPQLRVSIDGRRETVYSQRLIDDHMAFYLGAASALDLPSRIGADYVWVPKWIPVVAKLKERGWKPVFEGPESIILAKDSSDVHRVTVTASNSRPGAFPGP